MTAIESVGPTYEPPAFSELIDERTREILGRRRSDGRGRKRGWVIRRALLTADVVGLVLAFVAAEFLFGRDTREAGSLTALGEIVVFVATLPLWILLAKLHGIYEADEERTDHSTVDEFVGVLNVVTLASWLVFAGAAVTDLIVPDVTKLLAFWIFALVLVTSLRGLARWAARRRLEYLQNAVIVGAGDVGQLVARKFLQHPEYGVNVVGFVDDNPKPLRPDLGHLAVLGPQSQLRDVTKLLDVERVVLAFSSTSMEETVADLRDLRDYGVQIDVVPRLFDLVGQRVTMHDVEGLPLVGLPPARLSRSSAAIKRAIDIVGASLGLLVAAPLFAVIAWRIKRDSPGPVFFRQTRLGLQRREFTMLKFRTMYVGTDSAEHAGFIRATMSASATPTESGLYKLDRSRDVTRVGRWLRKTSIDELPQLINVLRGEMSLVGPRPCIRYETENFLPHHYERFLMPPGVTGLWQVTARACSTFGEALDMDVAYVRSWSLGLDLRLLFRTPFQVLRQRGHATA